MLVKTFRLIGLWLGDHAPGWPAVEGFVSPVADQAKREELAKVLDGGRPTDRAYMGWSTCRICGSRNGSGELTNGVFIWPEGLSHYIREHQVVLPAEIERLLRDAPPVDGGTIQAAVAATNEERDVEWWRSFRASPSA